MFNCFSDCSKNRTIFVFACNMIYSFGSTERIIIKFFLSSLLSFLLDYGLFNVFYAAFRSLAHRLFLSTALARILSSLFNFTVNRKAVFRSDAPLATTIARYYILWAFQLLASFGLVKLLSGIFGEGGAVVAILKLIVDMFLYFISFRVQQAWVFKPDNKQKEQEAK